MSDATQGGDHARTIALPLTGQTKVLGPGIIVSCAVLGLMCQSEWNWRLSATALVLLAGAGLWRRFLRQRPISLDVESDGRLSCTCADGRRFRVSRVLPGVIHPRLICARLVGEDGERRDLFVPGGDLPPTMHWQLRRRLVGFGASQSDSRRGT